MSARITEAHVCSRLVLVPNVLASENAHQNGTDSDDTGDGENYQRGPSGFGDQLLQAQSSRHGGDGTDQSPNESIPNGDAADEPVLGCRQGGGEEDHEERSRCRHLQKIAASSHILRTQLYSSRGADAQLQSVEFTHI